MKLPQGKIRFASVFLFMVLAVNFMAAQKLLQNAGDGKTADRYTRPSPASTASMEPAVPVPIGDTVVLATESTITAAR